MGTDRTQTDNTWELTEHTLKQIENILRKLGTDRTQYGNWQTQTDKTWVLSEHTDKTCKQAEYILIDHETLLTEIIQTGNDHERLRDLENFDHDETRTRNLLIRSQTPYPLGHAAMKSNVTQLGIDSTTLLLINLLNGDFI